MKYKFHLKYATSFLLYFGIREQKQILIRENRFIVFQNIPHWDLYTFACVWTNCRSTFATLIEVSPKHGFWKHPPLLPVSKNVDLSFYFLRTGIKRSYSVPSQDYAADDLSNQCFERSKMRLFDPMCEGSHFRGEEWSGIGGWFS